VSAFKAWYGRPPGVDVGARERQLIERVLPDLFGYHLVQLGCHHVEGLCDSSRIGHQVRIELGHQLNPQAALHCVEDALPLAPNSVDVLVMPHVLEFASDPRRVLREAERVLVGEGHLVIVGFNPFSCYGVSSLLLRWQGAVPWSGRFIALGRVKDWVQLLGFDVLRVERAVFRPPLSAANLGRRLEFLERLGAYLWPALGAVYVLVARKRVEGLTPLRASWRQRRRLVPGGVVEPTVRAGRAAEERRHGA